MEEEERDRANASTIRQEIEEVMRKGDGGSGWRCVAVTRDPRNSGRICITCWDEEELARVKSVAEGVKASGARVLRDQWYPVKVDNACRTAVLDENGELRVRATELMEKENEVKIAKRSWHSRKDSPKAYGSMVVYVTKRADAARLLEGQYFNVDGESALPGYSKRDRWCAGGRASSTGAGCSYGHQRFRQERVGRHWGRYRRRKLDKQRGRPT